MGWWGHYYGYCPKGADRIKAVIAEEGYNSESETHRWEVVDSSLKGTTVYLAIKRTKKETGEFEIYAVVALTHMDNNGYFMVKTMSEDMLPYYYDAPKHLLDKLTAPYNDSAREWREKCAAKRKARYHKELNNLAEGTKIRITSTNEKYTGRIVTVDRYRGRRAYIDWYNRVRFGPTLLDNLGWEVIE